VQNYSLLIRSLRRLETVRDQNHIEVDFVTGILWYKSLTSCFSSKIVVNADKPRGAISLAPWLQPGDQNLSNDPPTVSNGFSCAIPSENR
jgi:hypothetical protein